MAPYQRIVQSGDTWEVYEYSKPYNVSRSTRNYRKNKRKSQKTLNNRTIAKYRSRRSILRARQGFFRLVQANLSKDTFPALATFTIYEDVSLEEAYKSVRAFFKRISKDFPSIRYIVVPEWQKRGTLHFHALLWGINPEAILHEVPYYYRVRSNSKKYQRYIQFCNFYGFEPTVARGTRYFQRCWAKGFFDIVGATDNSLRIASYMAKYLVKGLGDPRLSNQRAYTTSHNVKRSRSEGANGLLDDEDLRVVSGEDGFVLDFTKEYDTLWLGTCTYKVYKKN